MARYAGTVTTPHHDPPAVTGYLADLRSVAEWDPSIDSASLTLGEAGTQGARYEIRVEFMGRVLSLDYQATAVEPPRRLVFEAETDSVSIRDVATVRPLDGGGSSVTWDAELRLKGARKLFEPVLRLAFARIGRRAQEGLAERLARPLPAAAGTERRAA